MTSYLIFTGKRGYVKKIYLFFFMKWWVLMQFIFAGLFPSDDPCDDLLSYFDATYIRGRRVGARSVGPRFSYRLWNHFDDSIECLPKTTNCCEGFHNSLNSLFLCKHPSVWKLFEGLWKDIAVNKLTAQNAEIGNYDPSRNKYRILAERLSEKVRNYRNESDKMRYLRHISHMTSW